MSKQYWLMKTEPDVFSLDQLKADKTTWWEGVRNYQARNFMQQMEVGDEVIFYHSSCEPPGAAGLAKVTKKAAPDKSQFNKKSEYFEKAATEEKPRWFCVEIGYAETFKNYVPLDKMRTDKALKDMPLLRPGQRLSIQPVTAAEFAHVKKMGGL